MSDYISDNDVIYTDETGNVRVRVSHDPHQEEPYFDGGMPVLRLDSSYYGETSTVEHVYGSTDYGFDAEDVWRRLSAYRGTRATLALFKRYVRIFHGSTTFHEYNVGITNEYGYLTFDTTAWWSAMGRTDVDTLTPDAWALLRALNEYPASLDQLTGRLIESGYPRIEGARLEAAVNLLIDAELTEMVTRPVFGSGWVRKDGAAQSFQEYRAWIVGECYTLVLEHRNVSYTITRDLASEDADGIASQWTRSESEHWAEVDSISGVYGDDWDNALDIARGNFDLPATTGDAAA